MTKAARENDAEECLWPLPSQVIPQKVQVSLEKAMQLLRQAPHSCERSFSDAAEEQPHREIYSNVVITSEKRLREAVEISPSLNQSHCFNLPGNSHYTQLRRDPLRWHLEFLSQTKELHRLMLSSKWFHLLLAGGFALACLSTSGCKVKPKAPSTRSIEVSVIAIQPQSLTLTTELPGRISAYLTADIRPQVSGIIKTRIFQEGSLVHAGQVLYQIDPAPYQASLSQARANLMQAEANLPALEAKANRYRDLAGHAVGQQDYDDALSALKQAQAAVESDKAAVESAKINLAYTSIKSPIAGRIGKSSVTVGGLASANQTTALATVQQLTSVYVDVVQANVDLLRLRKHLEDGQLQIYGGQGRKVSLYLEDGTMYPIQGKLDFRDVTVDTSTGSVNVRMTFTNPKEILLPGMYVRAIVEEGVKFGAILVPQQAVSHDPKGAAFAWVVSNGKVERRTLEIDRAIGNQWLVNAGLSASDQVIMEGGEQIREGTTVRAVPFNGNAIGTVIKQTPMAEGK